MDNTNINVAFTVYHASTASTWASISAGSIEYMMFCVVGEFVRLADLPCLVDLVFVGNPLEDKHSSEGTWMDEASKRLPNLKKLDGETASASTRWCRFQPSPWSE